MIAFRPMSITERIKRFLSPSYRRLRDEEMLAAIRQLVAEPERPCMIDEYLVPHGFGLTTRRPGADPWGDYDPR
jgi:hypothetical protein